jgi:acyl-CoA thioester hydrolase
MNYKTDKIKVRYNETDQMGIVHHSNYLKFFEYARIEWLEKLKMPYQEIERNKIILPVVNSELKFLKPLVFGDSFKVEVHCSKKPTSSIEFSYEIFNSEGEKTTVGKTLLAFLNSDTMKPVRCPKIISDLF